VVHALAPELTPALVIDPAWQLVHVMALELAEYCPALQGVHAVAPGDGPVLVVEPASHLSQNA
jgi:hypothetical protein